MKEVYKGRLPFQRPLTIEEIKQILEGAYDTYIEMQHAKGVVHEPEPGLTYEARHFRHVF